MYKRTIFAIHNMMLKHYSLLEKRFFLRAEQMCDSAGQIND